MQNIKPSSFVIMINAQWFFISLHHVFSYVAVINTRISRNVQYEFKFYSKISKTDMNNILGRYFYVFLLKIYETLMHSWKYAWMKHFKGNLTQLVETEPRWVVHCTEILYKKWSVSLEHLNSTLNHMLCDNSIPTHK